MYGKTLLQKIGNLRIRTKFVLTYSILLIIPVVLISLIYYHFSTAMIMDLAAKNTYDMIKTDNEIIDGMFQKVAESSLAIISDYDLFHAFKDAAGGKNFNVYYTDRQLNKVVQKYFLHSPYIYSIQIATSYYTFGSNTSFIKADEFKNTRIYATANAAHGKLVWIPTYDFTVMFNQKELQKYYRDRLLFSAVRVLNSFYLNENGVFATLDSNAERPVLIVNLKESLLREQFEKHLPTKQSQFYVIARDGAIVTSSEKGKAATVSRPQWLGEAVAKGSGTSLIRLNHRKMILCYDTLPTTGWVSVILVPVSELMGKFIPIAQFSTLYITLIFLAVSMVLAFLISARISKPIKELAGAMKRMGEGDFDSRLSVGSNDEVGYLISKFNHLNEKVKKLIEENYKAALREKESQIMALNLQMNPHFLYNTLNIINCIAMENADAEVSEMIVKLCDMLVYTVKDKNDIVPFEDEMKWLANYMYIMAKRFENKFTVCFDIDPALNRTRVPKLFLQPFVENAIIHGLAECEEDGVILISGGAREDGRRVFCVSDNGRGMDQDEIFQALQAANHSIGISNVNERIKLLYGNQFGVTIHSEPGKGTDIIVELPCEA